MELKAPTPRPPAAVPQNGQPLVIDLEFGNLMHPGEIKSLTQQMMICYASNNRAAVPYRLTLTGVNGNMKGAARSPALPREVARAAAPAPRAAPARLF